MPKQRSDVTVEELSEMAKPTGLLRCGDTFYIRRFVPKAINLNPRLVDPA